MSTTAKEQFETANDIQKASDELYRYDAKEHQRQVDEAKWTKDPKYFKNVKISAIALIKMVMHARSGKHLEVMGLMQGKIDGETMIVMDAFALPVEGTETRVNAEQGAMGFMVQYTELVKQVGRHENVIGWYHSHPGYGCWLSGIDVGTQSMNQKHQDPFLAVVIDPVRTMSAGKVELGAFRCYPEGYTPPDAAPSEYQSIPLEKIEDFGVHANSYYELDVSYFKSSSDRRLLDSLWNQYWVSTLSSSALLTNAEYTTKQLHDVGSKVDKANAHSMSAYGQGMFLSEKKRDSGDLAKASQDGVKAATEVLHGYLAQKVKSSIFNGLE